MTTAPKMRSRSQDGGLELSTVESCRVKAEFDPWQETSKGALELSQLKCSASYGACSRREVQPGVAVVGNSVNYTERIQVHKLSYCSGVNTGLFQHAPCFMLWGRRG